MTQKNKWASAINISRLHTRSRSHTRTHRPCQGASGSSAHSSRLLKQNTRPKLHFNGLSLLLAPRRLWARGNKMKLSTFPIPVSFCLMWSRIPVSAPTVFCSYTLELHVAPKNNLSLMVFHTYSACEMVTSAHGSQIHFHIMLWLQNAIAVG